MKNENTLILELCKFLNPDKAEIERLMGQPIHWPYVLGQLLFHRMGGAAYYVLRECGLLGKVNREVRNSLKTAYESGITKSESLKTALDGLAYYLHGADFPYALLKGSCLVFLYPSGLRTSNDVDILINQRDISKLEARLKTGGFEQGHIRNGCFTPAGRAEILLSRMNRGETVPFIKKVDLPGMEFLEIDINFSLDFKAKQESDLVARMLKNAPGDMSGLHNGLVSLEAGDFLIHLCCHLYKEAAVYAWVEMERDLSLYKFADIYLWLNEWAESKVLGRWTEKINDYSLNRECYYALLRTKELFGIKNVELDKLLADIRPGSTAYLKEIIRPDQNITYRYDEAFRDWLFTSGRKERLYETANAGA